ncbi:MAG: DUF3108 domain-containing protein [Firmicutes bacterium]|nr:DUF3108 domain-containing protein [Bacillota bacterium]
MKRLLGMVALVVGLVGLLVLGARHFVFSPAANRVGPSAPAMPANAPGPTPSVEPPGREPTANAVPAKAAHAEDPPALPFRAGEKLDYRVRWSFFPAAATVEMTAVGHRAFDHRTAWHFQAVARTLAPVRTIYELDDQFDSYSEAATLRSLQFEMHLREQGQEQRRVVQLMRGEEAPRSDGIGVRVPEETRDALGLIYYLRTVNWPQRPELRLPVYDGRTLYEIRAKREEADTRVEVPAGGFQAERISLRVFRNSQPVPMTSFQLWLAHDAARTPVLIEAELPFGSLRVELQPRSPQ